MVFCPIYRVFFAQNYITFIIELFVYINLLLYICIRNNNQINKDMKQQANINFKGLPLNVVFKKDIFSIVIESVSDGKNELKSLFLVSKDLKESLFRHVYCADLQVCDTQNKTYLYDLATSYENFQISIS